MVSARVPSQSKISASLMPAPRHSTRRSKRSEGGGLVAGGAPSVIETDGDEMDLVPGPELGGPGTIGGDEVTQAGIAADGLAIGHEEDGLAVGRKLERAGGRGLG